MAIVYLTRLQQNLFWRLSSYKIVPYLRCSVLLTPEVMQCIPHRMEQLGFMISADGFREGSPLYQKVLLVEFMRGCDC